MRWLPALLAGAALVGCGSQPTVSISGLGLPRSEHIDSLASATLTTSPDGGIYVNPDPLSVVLVGHLPMHPIADRVGSSADWAGLSGLGDLTVVGFRLRNDGKAGSDPQLNTLQIASDLAPPGTSSGPLRHFYHPTYPLAGLSKVAIGSDCSVHIDPGEETTVVLVYPPIRATPAVTWGRYGDFALSLHRGGALPADTADLRVTACTPPDTVPA
jgi:hypothetical protein